MVRIDISQGSIRDTQGSVEQRRHVALNAATILRYLIGDDDALETAIICKQPGVEFITTDQDIYDALACIRQYDTLKLPKLVKLLEVTKVSPAVGRKILTEERLDSLRKEALSKV
jgi:hypothetical protein